MSTEQDNKLVWNAFKIIMAFGIAIYIAVVVFNKGNNTATQYYTKTITNKFLATDCLKYDQKTGKLVGNNSSETCNHKKNTNDIIVLFNILNK
jgi:hypothetical protein